jgi:small-conductance mechanosensitive channel
VRKALDLMMVAAQENDRVLKAPPPATRLIGFGDNAVDLELRIWVNDPEAGVVNVASDIRLAIWDKFHAEGIEFPFPQRDLHITAADGLRDTMRDVIKEMRDDSAAPHS